MDRSARELLFSLEGRARDIAVTLEREIRGIAPYAELARSLGAPTWFLHERVVTLVPLRTRCQLHFWDGAALEPLAPHALHRPSRGQARFIPLRSMLDIDDTVLTLIGEAFRFKAAALARADRDVLRNRAFRQPR